MSDISKCTNEKCERKNNCYRYTCIGDMYQSYAEFNEKDCKYFIDKKC